MLMTTYLPSLKGFSFKNTHITTNFINLFKKLKNLILDDKLVSENVKNASAF